MFPLRSEGQRSRSKRRKHTHRRLASTFTISSNNLELFSDFWSHNEICKIWKLDLRLLWLSIQCRRWVTLRLNTGLQLHLCLSLLLLLRLHRRAIVYMYRCMTCSLTGCCRVCLMTDGRMSSLCAVNVLCVCDTLCPH